MATYFRLFDVQKQWLDSNGDPLANGQIFIYTAGTSTKATTYKDNAGATAHSNPIDLDSAGRMDAPVWVTTGDYKVIATNSTDTDPPSSGITEDNITPINDTTTDPATEWVSFSGTPTYSSGTVFTLAGDQTATFHVGRRVRWTDSGGTGYGTITASSYSDPTTTITVRGDAGDTIDSGLSAIAYGLISADNTSAPIGCDRITSGSVSASGTLEVTGLTTTYRAYLFVFDALKPGTDNVDFRLRLSDDDGSTYEADASDYAWALDADAEGAAGSEIGDADDSQIDLYQAAGSGAAETLSGTIELFNPAGSGITNISFRVSGQGQSPTFNTYAGAGQLQAAGATTAFQLAFSSGNIATMNWTLYGLRA